MWRSALKNYKNAIAARGEKADSEVSLEPLKQCAPLTLNEVKEAQLLPRPGGKQVVRLSFSTGPNDGIYEGRVEWAVDGLGTVKEDIERTNRYGTQSDCLPRTLLIMVPFVRMNSVGPQCNELKKTYDACFQYWFANHFLKGVTNDSMCREQFEKYNECVRNAMKEQQIDMNPVDYNIFNSKKNESSSKQ